MAVPPRPAPVLHLVDVVVMAGAVICAVGFLAIPTDRLDGQILAGGAHTLLSLLVACSGALLLRVVVRQPRPKWHIPVLVLALLPACYSGVRIFERCGGRWGGDQASFAGDCVENSTATAFSWASPWVVCARRTAGRLAWPRESTDSPGTGGQHRARNRLYAGQARARVSLGQSIPIDRGADVPERPCHRGSHQAGITRPGACRRPQVVARGAIAARS